MTYNYAPFATFNGTSDSIPIPSSTNLNLLQFSVACWFRTSKDYLTNPPEGIMVMKGGFGSILAGEQLNYGIWISDQNHLRAGFEETDGTDHIITTTGSTYNDGVWHHAICTYDGVKVRLYVNGALYQKDGIFYGVHTTSATPETNAQVLMLGKNPLSSQTGYFQGDMDEVHVWNRALSSVEVTALYNSNTVPSSGLVYSNSFGVAPFVTASTLQVFYSGGATNSNPVLSKGGLKSSVEINYSAIDATFKSSSAEQDQSGYTDFRGFYAYNPHPTKTLFNVKLYVHAESTSPTDQILVAKADEGKNNTMEALATVETVPAGSLTFTQANTPTAGISLGDLLPGEFIGFWIERIINPGTLTMPDDLGKVGLWFSTEGSTDSNTPPPPPDGGGGGDPGTTTNFKMAFMGDMSCSSDFTASLSRVKARAIQKFVSAGDNAYSDGSSCWINDVKNAGFSTAIVTFGNHDVDESENQPETKQNLINAFSTGGTYYERTFNNIYFLVLDSENNPETNPQRDAMKTKLQAASTKSGIEWIIVLHHRPFYGPSSNHPNEADARDVWDPLFDQYKVDLVVTAHNHLTWCSKLLKYGGGATPTVVSSGSGTPIKYSYNRGTANHGKLFASVGNGGKSHYSASNHPSYIVFLNDDTYGYLLIEVKNNGKLLDLRWYDKSDNLLNNVQLEHLV
jgi:hypothetical protein